MFILFDASIIQDLENQDGQYKSDLIQLLNETIICMYHKNHYVSTTSSFVAQTIRDFALSNDEKKVALAFDYIYRKYTILNSIIEHLNYVVLIGKFDNDWNFSEKKLRVNYKYAMKQHFWDETFLIPENIEDDRYLLKIIDYEKSKQIPFQHISYKFRKEQGGGGKNIKQVFLSRLQEHAFVLSILDTDKKSPRDDYGATAKCFEDDSFIHQYKDIFYYIPNIHEIENLFSSDVFMELSSYNERTRNTIKRIESKSISDADVFRAYLDIKKGYTYKKIDKNEYLKELLEVDFSSVSCSNGVCPCSENSCDKIFLEGASQSYLTDIFSNPNFDSKFNSAVVLLIPKIKDEWEKIFLIFITTCCSNTEKITGVN